MSVSGASLVLSITQWTEKNQRVDILFTGSDRNYAGMPSPDGLTSREPEFADTVKNVTVALGREAVLSCAVNRLGTHNVAWVKVDTQTILTVHRNVITRNYRIHLTHSDHRHWYLHITNVQESDRGYYMCQINTEPMKSQKGFLEVVVPPNILDDETSSDMVVKEGANVSLMCRASGYPPPVIVWQREDGQMITLFGHFDGKDIGYGKVEGQDLNITRVSRLHMGAYLCIASNGVPPSVSKRIVLKVHFPPMIWIPNQLIGGMTYSDVTLECHTEAYPMSINYWTTERGEMITSGDKYTTVMVDTTYQVHMRLKIHGLEQSDVGLYHCIAKNSLGETDGSIKLYHIPNPTTLATTTERINLESKDHLGGEKTRISSIQHNEIYGEAELKFNEDPDSTVDSPNSENGFNRPKPQADTVNDRCQCLETSMFTYLIVTIVRLLI